MNQNPDKLFYITQQNHTIVLDFQEKFSTRLVNSYCPHKHIVSVFSILFSPVSQYRRFPKNVKLS